VGLANSKTQVLLRIAHAIRSRNDSTGLTIYAQACLWDAGEAVPICSLSTAIVRRLA
jgi:hypothetical protein